MAMLTLPLPKRTGNAEEDVRLLYNWAYSLTQELRNILYKLDAQNVIQAKSVKASGVVGTLSEDQLPDIDISKITGDRSYVSVDAGEENGIVFYSTDSSGNRSAAAQIYYSDSETEGLRINTSGAVYLNGTKL